MRPKQQSLHRSRLITIMQASPPLKLCSVECSVLRSVSGNLQISSFFISNNPQVNLYKYNLGTLYNYCTTGLNLYKYDIAAEPLQV